MKSSQTQIHRPTPDNCFRLWLQAELARRCSNNAQYSLRAFALDLAIDHASLSQILRGKRRLTADVLERLAQRLGLSAERCAYYQRHQAAWAACPLDGASDGPNSLTQLAHEAAEIAGDILHIALLELSRIAGFRADARWIARVLDVSIDEVQLALQRLVHLGFLEMQSPERWVDRSPATVVSQDDLAGAAIERLYDQVRRYATRAALDVPEDRRSHSSTTIAIATERLPQALAAVARFRQKLTELLEQDGTRDDVYQLEIHLFPLTRLVANRERRDSAAKSHSLSPGPSGSASTS